MDNFSTGNNCQAIDNKNFGNCLYADIMETIDLGIVILNIKRQEVIFKNKFSSEIFNNDEDVLEYKGLLKLLLSQHGKNQPSEVFGKNFTLRYKNRLLGYTAYMLSENFIWIIIRDITERSRLESIAEAVNSMENISYIFSLCKMFRFIVNIQYFFIISTTVTNRTSNICVWQKIHFKFEYSITLTCFAPPTHNIKTKVSRVIAADF